VIGVTTGDPAGVGPEISLRAAADPMVRRACGLVLFGDFDLLHAQANDLGIPFDFDRISARDLPLSAPSVRAVVHIAADKEAIRYGLGSPASGAAAAENIAACAEACRTGRLHAMVTAPLHKKHFREAGYMYPGHTEFLAHLAGADRIAMAFLTERLKVVLATIHVPLRAAIDQITPDLIVEKLGTLVREFPRLGLPCARVAVAAVNPHAGEDGLLGTEDLERIRPAVIRARRLFDPVEIDGPIPADTLFHRAAQGEFDAVLALFHDQGLSPIKLMGFGEAVNVTLGLPFVRTSVDHGTAFDIAGKGIARHESMVGAIHWALKLAAHLLGPA
jgi:4-hydroxythreonine-4-phosphate dehydrogenase